MQQENFKLARQAAPTLRVGEDRNDADKLTWKIRHIQH
jgi:hypothetical protein